MKADDWPRRISLFVLGGTFAACGGAAAWVAFAPLTMKMDPALVGAEYWREVRTRAAANPAVVAVIACGCVGVVGGVALMAKPFVPRFRRPGGHL